MLWPCRTSEPIQMLRSVSFHYSLSAGSWISAGALNSMGPDLSLCSARIFGATTDIKCKRLSPSSSPVHWWTWVIFLLSTTPTTHIPPLLPLSCIDHMCRPNKYWWDDLKLWLISNLCSRYIIQGGKKSALANTPTKKPFKFCENKALFLWVS